MSRAQFTVRPMRAFAGLRRTRARPGQAGAASLIVVMVLFFLMSLVAAYTSRNLIFEQRTSVNQYRSTQAFEAAEAGLEWALTMLNSGRIGADCLEASAVAADTSFRQRYLAINPATGAVTPRSAPTVGTRLWPSCVSDGAGGWTCSCPADAAPALAAPAGAGVYPAFRVRFTADGLTRPGLIRIESNGCTRLADSCLDHPAAAADLEGRANVAAIVALASALPAAPGATLTVLGNADVGSTLTVYNTDAERGGVTVQAGGAFDIAGPPAWVLRSIPGTPVASSVVAGDAPLSALAATPDRAFASVFSMWPATYRKQPAAIELALPCAGGDCRPALAAAVAKNPDRVIWVPGDLTLASAGTIGSAPDPADTSVAGPAVVVVDGAVNFTAPDIRIHGYVYSRGGNWTGPGEIHGAAFVEGNLADTAGATIVMNSAVLDSLRLRSGSFVRAPGGWDDFRGRAP